MFRGLEEAWVGLKLTYKDINKDDKKSMASGIDRWDKTWLGGSWSSYIPNWEKENMPEDSTIDMCVVISQKLEGKWATTWCTEKRPFICERHLISSKTNIVICIYF